MIVSLFWCFCAVFVLSCLNTGDAVSACTLGEPPPKGVQTVWEAPLCKQWYQENWRKAEPCWGLLTPGVPARLGETARIGWEHKGSQLEVQTSVRLLCTLVWLSCSTLNLMEQKWEKDPNRRLNETRQTHYKSYITRRCTCEVVTREDFNLQTED